MKKKGQAALEFLMTYGWAILVVLVVIVVDAVLRGILDVSDGFTNLNEGMGNDMIALIVMLLFESEIELALDGDCTFILQQCVVVVVDVVLPSICLRVGATM